MGKKEHISLRSCNDVMLLFALIYNKDFPQKRLYRRMNQNEIAHSRRSRTCTQRTSVIIKTTLGFHIKMFILAPLEIK